MLTPFGWTQQVLSFDIPVLESDPSKTGHILWNLWQGLVATATVGSTSLAYIFYVQWKQGPGPLLYAGLPLSGLHFGPSAGRKQQGVLVMHSGHDDDYAARRFFTPGMPRSWQDGQLLTEAGWDGLMALANGWAMGVMAAYCGGDSQLLIAYPGIVDVTPSNLGGVAFRRVASLRACHYIDKAPELSSEIWP